MQISVLDVKKSRGCEGKKNGSNSLEVLLYYVLLI